MSMLRRADLQAGLAFVGSVAEACEGNPRSFPRVGVELLPGLVASEITTLSICDLVGGHRSVVAAPGSRPNAEDQASFDRHFHEHPLVLHHAVQRGRGAHRISDSIPFGRFRQGALYADYYRRIGIDHAVALPLLVDERRLVSFVLNRRGRDFTDRECALLDIVGRYLAAQFRQAERNASGSGRATLAVVDGGALSATDMASLPLTPREREVLGWVGAGKTDRDVACLIGCSHRTVQKHLERIYAKLGVETRTAAVMRALGATLH